jgi:hypothetical protein
VHVGVGAMFAVWRRCVQIGRHAEFANDKVNQMCFFFVGGFFL